MPTGVILPVSPQKDKASVDNIADNGKKAGNPGRIGRPGSRP
jgi:hypothetical protein